MKKLLPSLILLISIGVLVSACATSDDSSASSDGSSSTDITPPTVSSISPADGQTGVQVSDDISVTFSETMQSSSVTVNTDNTTCYGSLALSSDNFSTCVKMTSSITSSNSNKTFTFFPSADSVLRDTTYKIRVTTAVKDLYGNSMSSQHETSNGYTTTSGLFVTVGENGTILTSDNGSSWTSRAGGNTDNLSEVTFGNNIFVAVGVNGTIRTSSDNGSTWDNKTTHTTNFYGVTFGKNTFIVVGENGTIRTSSDNGTTWDNRTSGTTVNLRGVGF